MHNVHERCGVSRVENQELKNEHKGRQREDKTTRKANPKGYL